MKYDNADAVATKIAVSSLLVGATKKAFDMGFEQMLAGKGCMTQQVFFSSLNYAGLRNYHKNTLWSAYKSGRFEAQVAFDLKTKV